MTQKYVFVTGGVVSGLGKGIVAASIGLVMKSKGFKVVNQKFDPYLNIDPGTMNPYQHGEVFVTDDGAETDLDLGHYERFTDESLTKNNNTTAGRIYQTILNREREGGYHGGTVQVIPCVTDEILSRITKTATESKADIVITEIEGTVGDIESLPFIEAIRQVKYEAGEENCCYIHLTLVPFLQKSGELKSKPTQHSVKELQGLGIQPDIIMCRTDTPVTKEIKEKLGLFCNVSSEAIIQNLTASSIYEVPLMLEKEGLGSVLSKRLNLPDKKSNLNEWEEIVSRFENPEKEIKIGLAGKYIELHDAYLSVVESLIHAGIYHKAKVNIEWINTEKINTIEEAKKELHDMDGIIIPGGFGNRGIEGMILCAQYARENNVPFLGICLGMQIAVIEYSRHILGLKNANSTEINPKTENPVIDLMSDQENVQLGGTLRLGKYRCALKEGTKAWKFYGKVPEIEERHRHRYEFNNKYRNLFEESKMTISGINPERNLVEIIEIPAHKWFVAGQFHPEFKSRPNRPHPLFRDFIGAATNSEDSKN